MRASIGKIIVYEHFNCLIFMDLDADLLGRLVAAKIKYDFFDCLTIERAGPTTDRRVPFRTLNQG